MVHIYLGSYLRCRLQNTTLRYTCSTHEVVGTHHDANALMLLAMLHQSPP
jgi:hypothetical protein